MTDIDTTKRTMKNVKQIKTSPVNPSAIGALERALSAIVNFNSEEECLPSKLADDACMALDMAKSTTVVDVGILRKDRDRHAGEVDALADELDFVERERDSLKSALEKIRSIRWGNDGDCGAMAIIDSVL